MASFIETFGESEVKTGFITIQLSEDEYMQLDIGSYTAFETLDEGAKVCVEVDTLGDTGILYAKKVTFVETSAKYSTQ